MLTLEHTASIRVAMISLSMEEISTEDDSSWPHSIEAVEGFYSYTSSSGVVPPTKSKIDQGGETEVAHLWPVIQKNQTWQKNPSLIYRKKVEQLKEAPRGRQEIRQETIILTEGTWALWRETNPTLPGSSSLSYRCKLTSYPCPCDPSWVVQKSVFRGLFRTSAAVK